MKQLFTIILILGIFTSTHAQNQKTVNTIQKLKTVNFKEAAKTSSKSAYMSNIHMHPTPQPSNIIRGAKTDDQAIRRELGTTTTPSTVSTIDIGPNHDGGYPYDNSISVSNSGQVVAVSNLGVYIYNLNDEIAYSVGFHGLFETPGDKFDPQVAYDSYNDRFIVIVLRTGVAENSGVEVAVTTTSDPTGDWNIYFIPNTHSDPASWVDFPHIAVSNQRMYIHANIHDDLYALESNIWDIPVVDAYNGDNFEVTKHITSEANIRFVIGADSTNYGNSLYGINAAIANEIDIYEFSDGNMNGPYAISTYFREGAGIFETNGKVLYPGGDANNSYSYIKNNTIYYAQAGALYTDDTDSTILFFGKINLNVNDLSSSSASPVCYLIDGERNYTYAQMAYAGYTNSEGVAGSLLTALYGSPNEYLGTICYHIDPDENVSSPLIVAQGQGQVSTRFGDYIQSVYDPSGTRQVWISGQFGSTSETEAIEDLNDPDIYLGNIIAKIQVPLPTENNSLEIGKQTNYVFPNPTSDFFTTSFTVYTTGKHEAKLYNSKGELVSNLYSRNLKKGEARLTFNTITYTPGTYIITITNSKGIEILKQRVIIQ